MVNTKQSASKAFTFYREVGDIHFPKLFTQTTGRNSKGGPGMGEATNVYQGEYPEKSTKKLIVLPARKLAVTC